MLAGLAMLSCQEPGATELPSITWLHTATPSGEFDPAMPPKGDEDSVLHWLIDRLPGYRQTIVEADVARMMALLQSADGVCVPMLLKTDQRKLFVLYSQRLLWALPARVIVLERETGRFDALSDRNGALQLDRLLSEPGMTGAYENGRPISPTVDEVLERHRGDGGLVEAPAGSTMYAMLAGGRIDWAIGHLSEIRHLLDAEYPDARFRSYAIAGNAALLAAPVGCSKGQQSARIIADIDRMLRAQHVKDPAQEAYDLWLDPADRTVLRKGIAEAERGEGE